MVFILPDVHLLMGLCKRGSAQRNICNSSLPAEAAGEAPL